MKPKLILSLLTLNGLVANAKTAFAARLCILLCMSVFCVPALASADPDAERAGRGAKTAPLLAQATRLSVSAAWTDGEVLHIEVLDNQTGATSAVELQLSDYADNAQNITIQAVDADGNKSGVIEITNPYYKPAAIGDADSDAAPTENADGDTAPTDNTSTESAVPDGSKSESDSRPFTPDGTGGVVDNATEQDGKEFFTITTENENTFYLIVDRQKAGENVYLLNTVTENDLMALAEKGDGTTVSAVPDTEPAPVTPAPTPEPTPEPVPEPETGVIGGNSSLIFVVVAVAVAGIAGYYFKIVKPKRQSADAYEDESDFEDDSDDPNDYDKEEEKE